MKHAARVVAALLFVACSRPQPPVPNQVAPLPDLTSAAVLVLPVHAGAVPGPAVTAPGDLRTDGVSDLDGEIAYWLSERAGNVRWVLPAAIDRMLVRSPGLNIKPRALDVASFRRTRVERIGDPLFGDLKRLASILDARFALVPVAAEFKASDQRMQAAFVLIDTTFGDVIWFGVVDGESAADLAQRMAARFAPRRTSGL